MKCRRVYDFDGKRGLVFFGSCGKDENGKAIFYDGSNYKTFSDTSSRNYSLKQYNLKQNGMQYDKATYTDFHDNYSSDNEAIKDSAIQRLSILKGELWYDYLYGLPLLEKSSKALLDAYTIQVISDIPGIEKITNFSSTNINYTYNIDLKVKTIYSNDYLSIKT